MKLDQVMTLYVSDFGFTFKSENRNIYSWIHHISMSSSLHNQDTKLRNTDNGDNNSVHCILSLVTITKIENISGTSKHNSSKYDSTDTYLYKYIWYDCNR